MIKNVIKKGAIIDLTYNYVGKNWFIQSDLFFNLVIEGLAIWIIASI